MSLFTIYQYNTRDKVWLKHEPIQAETRPEAFKTFRANVCTKDVVIACNTAYEAETETDLKMKVKAFEKTV